LSEYIYIYICIRFERSNPYQETEVRGFPLLPTHPPKLTPKSSAFAKHLLLFRCKSGVGNNGKCDGFGV
jgi:hypothetical protein